MINVKLSTFQA